MEIDPTLSIVAAAVGGILMGWQLRADFDRRGHEKRARHEPAETPPVPNEESARDGESARVPIHTPAWERPVLTERPND